MKSLFIFKVGDTFADVAAEIGDFEQWITAGLGPTSLPLEVIDPRSGMPLPAPQTVAGAIITGSHAMVTDRETWSENLAAWLRTAVAEQVPILGICYGHQLLAHALGGEVSHHPVGLEIGTVPVTLNEQAKDDALFGGMPTTFPAQVVHRQSVRTLPSGATLLGGNEFEPHHAFRVGASAWGIQFHPEFTPAAMASYVKHMAREGRVAGKPADAVLQQIKPTDEACSVLKKFGALVG